MEAGFGSPSVPDQALQQQRRVLRNRAQQGVATGPGDGGQPAPAQPSPHEQQSGQVAQQPSRRPKPRAPHYVPPTNGAGPSNGSAGVQASHDLASSSGTGRADRTHGGRGRRGGRQPQHNSQSASHVDFQPYALLQRQGHTPSSAPAAQAQGADAAYSTAYQPHQFTYVQQQPYQFHQHTAHTLDPHAPSFAPLPAAQSNANDAGGRGRGRGRRGRSNDYASQPNRGYQQRMDQQVTAQQVAGESGENQAGTSDQPAGAPHAPRRQRMPRGPDGNAAPGHFTAPRAQPQRTRPPPVTNQDPGSSGQAGVAVLESALVAGDRRPAARGRGRAQDPHAGPLQPGVSGDTDTSRLPVAKLGPTGTAQCVVCFADTGVLSVGPCNHWEVCAQCCLRLRLLYADNTCPLCKAENEEVVVFRAPPKDAPPPDFARLAAHREELWVQPRWAKGVLVQSYPPGSVVPPGARSGPAPLQAELRRTTARACPVCDTKAHRPFMTNKQLQDHVRTQHSLALCELCLSHGHKFALESNVYTPQELVAHEKEAHPRCKFCRTNFYGSDELFQHMQREHFYCHVCRRQHNQYNYFQTAHKLVDHLRASHYLCEEPECVDCQTAFATEEELLIHRHTQHAGNNARGGSSRARPLLLDLRFSRPGQDTTPSGDGGADRNLRGGPRGAGRGAAAGASRPVQLGDVAEGAGGLAVIDDDRGAATHMDGPTSTRGVWGVAAGARGLPRAEDFPSLNSALGAPRGGTPVPGGATHTGSPTAQGSASGLAKVTVRCPCGRREFHTAVRPGDNAPELDCNAECAIAQRRAALADAFGVSNPATHVSSFDRHRDVKYSPALLQAAKTDSDWICGLETQIAEFASEPTQRRVVLAPMTARERGLVHELAEAYGLATSSTGHEPHRRIQLLKTAATGAPRTTLMASATALSWEEVAALGVAETVATEACKLKLVDVAPGTNVAHYFRHWSDSCSVTYGANGTAVVTFNKETVLQQALAALGGGIRGVFRIVRPAGGAVSGSAGPSASGSSGMVPGPPPPAVMRAPASAAGGGSSSAGARGSGWLVMQSKRGGRPAPVIPSPATRTSSRGEVVSSLVDPWLTPDEAALAEQRATEAAIRAAHAGDVVFESWEDQAVEAVSVFPTAGVDVHALARAAGTTTTTSTTTGPAQKGADAGGGGGVRGRDGDSGVGAPSAPVIGRSGRVVQPLSLQPNMWEVLGDDAPDDWEEEEEAEEEEEQEGEDGDEEVADEAATGEGGSKLAGRGKDGGVAEDEPADEAGVDAAACRVDSSTSTAGVPATPPVEEGGQVLASPAHSLHATSAAEEVLPAGQPGAGELSSGAPHVVGLDAAAGLSADETVLAIIAELVEAAAQPAVAQPPGRDAPHPPAPLAAAVRTAGESVGPNTASDNTASALAEVVNGSLPPAKVAEPAGTSAAAPVSTTATGAGAVAADTPAVAGASAAVGNGDEAE